MSGYAMRSDASGVHFWRVEADGERVPITAAEWRRHLDWYASPIFDQVLADLGACLNCRCTDCGCCVGCGGVDADLDPPGSHGYVCVM
ncbi:hypothetical protein SEA_ELLIE_80 [Mycobacterium phage Ellie]|uniref:Uncharacterized protein n=1 Tax=Mycobacterium phage Ellie TaxID=2762405 RepID=A0A7G8LM31_9CAUD|nr:hypothetical protein I5G88_gp80 [Mycobacterium phage Ellie]QNJ58303.1 hypothetical protein SEA_ELLIE_80 [Mycobacterium phage Ellie]